MKLQHLKPTGALRRLGMGPSVQGFIPLLATKLLLDGYTRNNDGSAIVPGVLCTLFRVTTELVNGMIDVTRFTQVDTPILSDANGYYSFSVPIDNVYRVMFDIAGPTRAGVTDKSLTGNLFGS